MKILIIDDAAFAIHRIQQILEDRGYNVITANSGPEAIDLFKKDKPDITFCDVEMPGMSGLQVLAEIKRLDPSHKVVMLTSNTRKETIMEAKSKGASGYIAKPFEPSQLIDKIHQFE